MTLRLKTLLIVSLVLTSLIIILFFTISRIVLGSFGDLETADVEKNVERVSQALDNQRRELEATLVDWAHPGDALSLAVYADLLDNEATKPSDERENKLADLMANLNLNIFLFAESPDSLYWSKSYDEVTETVTDLPESLRELLNPDSPLLRHSNTDIIFRGLIMLPENPLLIAAAPLASFEAQDAGSDVLGSMVMGTYLDANEVARLEALTELSLTMLRVDDPALPQDFLDASNNLTESQGVVVKTLDSETVAGYMEINDIFGQPGLLVRVDIPRSIIETGRVSMQYLLIALLIVGLALIVVVLFLLDRLVLIRLARLNKDISGIQTINDLSGRVSVSGKDELAHVAGAVNDMLDGLEMTNMALHEEKLRSEAHAEALQNELEKGRQLQRHFLPATLPEHPGWELQAFLSPARDVSGDFYDAFTLPGGLMGIVIADVCDKGVGSALFMALSRSLLRVFSGEIQLSRYDTNGEGSSSVVNASTLDASSGETNHETILGAVGLTNDYIAETHSETSMFTTLFFGVLDPTTGLLTYVNGGHEPPIILGPDGIKARLAVTGPAVGVIPDMRFAVQETYLDPGDFLVSYTDGVTDARNPAGESFTEAHLLTLMDPRPASADEMLERIKSNVLDHISSADQFDDITLLALRRVDAT